MGSSLIRLLYPRGPEVPLKAPNPTSLARRRHPAPSGATFGPLGKPEYQSTVKHEAGAARTKRLWR